MKSLLLLIATSVIVLHGAELVSVLSTSPQSTERPYAIQIFTSKSYEGAAAVVKKLPPKYHDGIMIYKVGAYYATRYIDTPNQAELPAILADFKRSGFTSPVVFPYNPNRIPLNQKIAEKAKKIAPTGSLIKTQKLSEHEKTRLILDAQKAFQNGDITQSIIYYEMMISSGMDDRPILLNLAYLYGKEGAFHHLERLIDNKRSIIDYLYAYGVGALESHRSNLYSDLSPYLALDKSGRLAMLCGYHFEHAGDIARAYIFNRMAHDINPSDPHILYAYARSVDMKGDTKQAIFYYTQITQLGSSHETLRQNAQSRLNILRSQP